MVYRSIWKPWSGPITRGLWCVHGAQAAPAAGRQPVATAGVSYLEVASVNKALLRKIPTIFSARVRRGGHITHSYRNLIFCDGRFRCAFTLFHGVSAELSRSKNSSFIIFNVSKMLSKRNRILCMFAQGFANKGQYAIC